MERIHVGGRTYTDPDVLSLIRTRVESVDPQREVIKKARELNQRLREMGDVVGDPRRRMEILASLAGIKVSPMVGASVRKTTREALIYSDSDGSRRADYDPTLPDGRVNFSIGHEIVHTFFPSSTNGARFRSMCTDDSKEGNELEQLCHRGAAELLMPQEEFTEELRGVTSLVAVPRLCLRFGSSFEATVYRMASTFDGVAVAGLLQYRYRKDEARRMASLQQPFLFGAKSASEVLRPKLRRQSLHTSDNCDSRHQVRWNKSFNEESCVYRAAVEDGVQSGRERLPNESGLFGNIEAVRAPYQRPNMDTAQPDILFLWRA